MYWLRGSSLVAENLIFFPARRLHLACRGSDSHVCRVARVLLEYRCGLLAMQLPARYDPDRSVRPATPANEISISRHRSAEWLCDVFRYWPLPFECDRGGCAVPCQCLCLLLPAFGLAFAVLLLLWREQLLLAVHRRGQRLSPTLQEYGGSR